MLQIMQRIEDRGKGEDRVYLVRGLLGTRTDYVYCKYETALPLMTTYYK